jgi:hypothetical protein
MTRPEEQTLKCPICGIHVACEGGVVPRHGKIVDGVGFVGCSGIGKDGEAIKEKKHK